MRPYYENQRDLSNEHLVATILKEKGIDLVKMPVSYRLDFAILRKGKVRGFAEVKTRNNRHNKYPTLMISLGKVMAARQLSEVTGTPSFLLVKFLDGLYWCNFASPFNLEIGGRTDRQDAADIEPVAHFAISAFRRFGKSPAESHSPEKNT
jgi:hypothetical protein